MPNGIAADFRVTSWIEANPATNTVEDHEDGDVIGFAWPSGEGVEIATIRGDLEGLQRIARARMARAPRHFRMFDVREDGARAVLLLDLMPTPVSFYVHPSEAPGVIAVIADAKADAHEVIATLENLLGPEMDLRSAAEA